MYASARISQDEFEEVVSGLFNNLHSIFQFQSEQFYSQQKNIKEFNID